MADSSATATQLRVRLRRGTLRDSWVTAGSPPVASVQPGRGQDAAEVTGDVHIGGCRDARAGHDHQVETVRDVPALEPQRLTKQALGPVPGDGAAHLAADHEPGARRAAA